ncbi:MAG: hypothetical protein WC822_06035 [Candidatus Paceibacterota bacterium]|jgi:hypothetical protein
MGEKIKSSEIIIVDVDGNEIDGTERERKIRELKRDGTMLDAWIQGETDDNPYEIIWE